MTASVLTRIHHLLFCVCFSSTFVFSTAWFLLSVSELLMGEVDSSTLLSLLPTEKSRVSGHVFFFFLEKLICHIKTKKKIQKMTPSVQHMPSWSLL